MIDKLQRLAAGRSDILSLAGGLPSQELFPRGALGRAFTAAVSRPQCAALQYGWPEGDQDLRSWVASWLWSRGAPVGSNDVIITNGAQQALTIASELLLDPGDTVEVDRLSYPGALNLFRGRGAQMAIGASADARCAYVMPGVGNPLGVGLSATRRRELLERRVSIIADEAYAELRFDGKRERPLLADARDRVWHVGTFSKTLCPGLRVGFLITPPLYREHARSLKNKTDLQASSLSQVVLEEFLRRDNFEARLAKTRRFYARRAERLVHALRRRFPGFRVYEPEGGFSVLVDTDHEGDELALLSLAMENGVSFDPGSQFRPDGAPSPISMRLSFSSISMLSIDEAVSRLSRAWSAYQQRSSAPFAVEETTGVRRVAPRQSYIASLAPPTGKAARS